MFEKFTDQTREVFQLANQQARQLHQGRIGTEHVLLGLLMGSSGVAIDALRGIGADLDLIRRRIDEVAPTGDVASPPAKLPMTPQLKKVIGFAMEEAAGMNYDYYGTEHLILGLIRESDGFASKVLRETGVEENRLRSEITRLLEGAE